MKKFLSIAVLVMFASLAADAANVWVKQGTGNQKLGFGTVISATANDSIAIGSSAGACSVTASQACQIGTGENTEAGTLQYRAHQLIDVDGGLGIGLFGVMMLKYPMYMEDWFEAGGYIANASLVGTNGLPVYGAKFSETAGRGSWLLTVVDGGGDNAETVSIMNDERNGILAMVPNNAALDGMNAELQGESILLRSGYTSAFNTRWLTTDTTNCEVRVGLHRTGTTAAITTPGTDYIGFHSTNAIAYFKSAKNSTATNITMGAVANADFHEGAFAIVDTDCLVMWDGVLMATIPIASGVIPDDEALSPVMANRALGTTQCYVKWDYIGTVQTR